MNSKLIMTLAVSGALAGLAGSVYAQEAPKPETEKPELQQLVPQLKSALPWFIAEGDDEKKDAPKPELIAEGDDEKKDAPKPELIAEVDDEKKPESSQLIAEGEDEKKPEGSQLIAEGDDEKKPELMLS